MAGSPICGQWKITERDLLGNIVTEKESENLVVNSGRNLLIYFLLGFTGASSVVALGVDASSTAAAVTQTQLVYELRGNPTRKSITNTSNVALSASDIVLETTTIGSTTYYEKIVLQAQFAAGDGNNGNVFNGYGLFTTTTLPATPTASSGIMFNRFVDPAPITKTADNSITIQVTLRF